MKKLTAQIIMMCKQPQKFGEFNSHREAIIAMLSARNSIDKTYWKSPESKQTVEHFIYEAALDYLDSCDRPSFFVFQIMECWRINTQCRRVEYNYYDAILSAFSIVDVKNNNSYVNGFTEENTKIPSPKDFKEETK